ncbi:DUF4926 domain-containing protein [Brevundimonas staleyi]|uniref:DUF4926 domain-containing protein n=1 Tax=Brevundimonas staleyi TaxID=74326 RepID=A0ABW0FW53_9CAUL
MAEELDVVALKVDRPDLGLVTGDRGAVVMVFDAGACEVEFVNSDGSTRAMATFGADEIEVVWRIADSRQPELRKAAN